MHARLYSSCMAMMMFCSAVRASVDGSSSSTFNATRLCLRCRIFVLSSPGPFRTAWCTLV